MPSRPRVVGLCDRQSGVVFLLFSTLLHLLLSYFIFFHLPNFWFRHEVVYKKYFSLSDYGGSYYHHRLHSRQIPTTPS